MEASAAEIAKRGFERLLLFTEGVTAIAVTLLILPVVDAVLLPGAQTASTLDLLDQLQGELVGFMLSFAVIVVLWLAHKQVSPE